MAVFTHLVPSYLTNGDLTTNKQRVLMTLLRSRSNQGWVSRSQFKGINSATRRLRELRELGFQVECSSDPSLVNRLPKDQRNQNTTFYRLVPSSVNAEKISKVLEGVIAS